MITDSPFNANLAIIDPGEEGFQAAVSGLEDYKYTQERSYGFNISNSREKVITGHLVEKTPVKIETYDEDIEEVVDREVERTTLIPFHLDFDIGLLSIFSDQSDTNKLISRIAEASSWQFSITESQLPIEEVYASLQSKDWAVDVSSIRIRNFEAGDSLSGTYTIKDVGDVQIRELINSHSSNITILRANIKTPSQQATFGFFQSGTIRLYSSLESEDPLWTDIKTIAREAYNG